MKLPLVLMDGSKNPYETACQFARHLLNEGGILQPARAHTQFDPTSSQTLALADQLYFDDHPNSQTSVGFGNIALFLPSWRVKSGASTYTVTLPAPPTLTTARPFYPLHPIDRWYLSGITGTTDAVPNPYLGQSLNGWEILTGTWHGPYAHALWTGGAGADAPPYPRYAAIQSTRFPIDNTKSYFLSYKHRCQPHDRYTYDNATPRLIVEVWQFDSAGNPVGTNPVLADQINQDRMHVARIRNWHTHDEFAGTVNHKDSTLSNRWHPSATQAQIRIYCNYNKHGISEVHFRQGAEPTITQENHRLVYEWNFPAHPDGTTAELLAFTNLPLTTVGSIRIGMLKIVGLPTPADDALTAFAQTAENGEEFPLRLVAYRAKEVGTNPKIYAQWEDLEFDTSLVEGTILRSLSIRFALQPDSAGYYQVRLGSAGVDEEDTPNNNPAQFLIRSHPRVPQGTQTYLLTQVQSLGSYTLESQPTSFDIDLRIYAHHGVEVIAQATTTTRLYRLIDGLYYQVAEADPVNSVVTLADTGEVGGLYLQSGLLPNADLATTYENRVLLAQRNSRILYISAENDPLRYAETALTELDGFTLILPEPIQALSRHRDGALIYGTARTWLLARYHPPQLYEINSLLPASPKCVHEGYIATPNALYSPRAQLLRYLPDDLHPPTLLRTAPDGTLLIAKDNLCELLTPAGWTRFELPASIHDALYYQHTWTLATSQGILQLNNHPSQRLIATWRSTRFTTEGPSRPTYLWLIGSATVTYRDNEGTIHSQRLANHRWQVPVSHIARWWEIELTLDPSDIVYTLHLDIQKGGLA